MPDARANAHVPADLQEGITHQLETMRRWQINNLNRMLNGNSSEGLFQDSTISDVQKMLLRVHGARDEMEDGSKSCSDRETEK
jgi:hypothetical protein